MNYVELCWSKVFQSFDFYFSALRNGKFQTKSGNQNQTNQEVPVLETTFYWLILLDYFLS